MAGWATVSRQKRRKGGQTRITQEAPGRIDLFLRGWVTGDDNVRGYDVPVAKGG
jgi:hypothetical protein